MAGVAVGFASVTLRRSAQRLQEAIATEAAAAERDRLARDIHDGVLQVLALVRRRGPTLGDDELVREAAEQEVSLRRLITRGPPGLDGPDDEPVDLGAAVGAALPARAVLAVPPEPVEVPGGLARSVVAVVREAAANADAHAGPGSGLWVLLEDDEDAVTVSVRDDGAGIPGGRLDAARDEGHLGVASSIRGRVAELGGHRAPGHRAGRGHGVGAAVPPDGGRSIVSAVQDGAGVRVMVVDDHPMWREGVARDLGERGFDVVATAADGAAAVRIAPAVRPDVVVMDLQMPHLDGAGATAAILAILPATRILVLSASAEHGDVLGAVQAGAAGYLVKSAQAAELVDAVRRTAAGQAVFGPELAGLVLGEFRRRTPRPGRRRSRRRPGSRR